MWKIKIILSNILIIFCFVNSQAQSVLSTGTWYKLSVSENGIHCITAADLTAIGISVSTIDPRNISIYGNKSGMLPFQKSLSFANDLKELAIYVKGEGDGIFDLGDTIFFYGQSQDEITPNLATHSFTHRKNIYSDSTYYFLTIGNTPGKRIQVKQSQLIFTNVTNTYTGFLWHETDSINFLHSGQSWYGEFFDTHNNFMRNFNFDVSHISPGDSLKIVMEFAGRSLISASSHFTFSNSGYSKSRSIGIVGSSPQDQYALNYKESLIVPPPVNSGNIQCTWQSPDTLSIGYLNYLELNFNSKLEIYIPQQLFTDLNSTGAGNITKYQISNAPLTMQIWDVTDPVNVSSQDFLPSFPSVEFSASNDSVHTYLAFDGTYYLKPVFVSQVANQNLHSIVHANYIIVTADQFLSEANTLASFRQSHDGLQTSVVTTSQVYNEYSSGSQDPVGIRNFIKQVFDSSAAFGDSLKYVLFFGNGSYDFRGRLGYTSSFVPTYESVSSLNRTTSYCADQFYTYLDNAMTTDLGGNGIYVGVGRIPVRNSTEAAVVNRIIDYSNVNSFGPWRKKIYAVADDRDHNTHFNQMEALCNNFENAHCEFDIDKIYLDAYTWDTTGPFTTFPGANFDLARGLHNGGLVVHYIGHGGPGGWADERVLDSLVLQNTNNNNKAPLFLNCTSEFNLFDDPAIRSCAQILTTSANSSGIASIASSRLSFSSSNYNLAQKIDGNLYQRVNNIYPRLGDVIRMSKQQYYSDPYVFSVGLLGDPAMRLNYPENLISISTVNGNQVSTIPDTIIPGQTLQLGGEILDPAGTMMSTFNGTVQMMIFDQKTLHYTLGNASAGTNISTVRPFYEWDDTLNWNLVSAPVMNGLFSISFQFPYTLDSAIGIGKISLYADNGVTDASGCFENFVLKNFTTGITEIPGFNITVGPNPASDKITFEIQGETKGRLQFTLTDVSGQIISNHRIDEKRFQVIKSDLAAGVYFYTILNEKNESVKRGKIVFE